MTAELGVKDYCPAFWIPVRPGYCVFALVREQNSTVTGMRYFVASRSFRTMRRQQTALERIFRDQGDECATAFPYPNAEAR